MLSVELLCIITAIAVFAATVAFGVIRDKLSQKNNPREKRDGEWLFSDWGTKVYYSFTKQKPEILAKKLGVDAEKYAQDCCLIKVKNRMEDVITKKILGFICALVFLAIGAIAKDAVIALVGLVLGFVLTKAPMYQVEKAAKERRNLICEEMSRFMDLLQTALYINLPIEEAIMITARHLKGTVISEEFMGAVADTRLGTYNWQGALERLASKFDIDSFSDFVLDIVTSYNKGLNIYDVVVRKNKELKKSNLLILKERAAKLNSEILVPVTIFKLIPMLILFCIPIVIQLKSSGF